MRNIQILPFFSGLIGTITALAVAMLLFAQPAHANPSYLSTGVTNGTGNSLATTSPAFMTPGTGTTTTNVYDSYNGGSTNTKADTAALLIQNTASSTATVLSITLEYSQDGQDWYADDTFSNSATTTSNPNISAVNSLTWTFASSTIGQKAVGSTQPSSVGSSKVGDRDSRIIVVKTPLRYVRAIISDTGNNASVWTQIVPIKQLQ